jgi:regulator of protease activity HflC (stomatin/prohibitin superfamily)
MAVTQAEQAVVRAEGEANARIEEARGEAEANRLLTESLNPLLLQWQAVQKLQDNINIALVPSDGGLILDVGNLPIASPEASPAP